MKTILLAIAILSCALTSAWAQGHGCEANIPDPQKENCHPEPDSSEEECRARGCVWCPNEPGGPVPWCFHYNPEATTPPGSSSTPPDSGTTPDGPPPGFGCDDGYLPDDERVDCAPGEDSEWGCRVRNCTWCPADCGDCGKPWCYIPGVPGSTGYVMIGEPTEIPNGLRVNLEKAIANRTHSFALTPKPSAWEGEADTLTLDATFDSDYRLRVKIYNVTRRFEVPMTIYPTTGGNSNPLYEIQFKNDPHFSFQVVRKSSGTILFDSSPGKFIFANQYLTLSWRTGSEHVYGIGENEQHTFKHDFNQSTTWALWAKDQPPAFTANMYGVHPYLTVLEEDGNTHSVAVINSNAQQFTMKPGPIVEYITTGGILDFYFFLGPTPENVVAQFTEAVGRPPMPPYWSLGFQLCRFGYNNLENMKAAVDRTAFYGIPQDVQYGDIDIMRKALDFTYDQVNFAGLPDYIRELQSKGMKFITILDPAISTGEPRGAYEAYDLGTEMDVWLKRQDGTPVVGKVWPEAPIHFPDYSKNSTREWWVKLVSEFHDLLAYDGLWIDMNEPANFVDGDSERGGCEQNSWNNPPFVPRIEKGYLAASTICADHVQEAGLHYDVHSLYGWFMSEPTLEGTKQGVGKRTLVLSRSTFLGSGQWVAHWLGDNWSKWDNLHFSIIGMLQFNQFGIPFVGADICGHWWEATADMCQRWHQLGAFYPFSRNHNIANTADQDPGAFGEEVAEATKKALLVRYTLLPYLYTLFYQAEANGGTVARALWHNYPTDPVARDIDRQFMWGSGLLISAALEENVLSVDAYFPNNRFYNYFTGEEQSTRGDTATLSTPMDAVNVHVAGGNVIPTQEPAVNTELSRNNPFGLIVALDDDGNAQGEFFYDDGDSIGSIQSGQYYLARFTVQDKSLQSGIVRNGYADMAQKRISTVRFLGEGNVNTVTVNGNSHLDFTKLPSGEVLIIGLALDPTQDFVISWT